MLPTRLPRVVFLALAVVAVACGYTTKPTASTPNLANSFTLGAITGAPANVPTAVSFLGGPIRADSRFVFDVAFDIDPQGNVIVLPVRAVAGALGQAISAQVNGLALKRVGLQKVSGPFESVRSAPQTGYDTLSVQTMVPGNVFAVELVDFANCYTGFGGSTLYAKITLDSVNTTTRRLYTRSVVDPNCGYRGLVADSIPTS
jgi:hypothetical protein